MSNNTGEGQVGSVREAEVRASVVARARALLDREVDAELQRRLARWAANDEAPFPTAIQVRADLQRELETLCRGLGHWSFVAPTEVFVGQEFGWFD